MIMDRLYGGVCYAGIDTDPELKYPKGAGRVAFSNQQSYIAAISARFVQLQHGEIDKRVSGKKRELSVFRPPLSAPFFFLFASPTSHFLFCFSQTLFALASFLSCAHRARFLLDFVWSIKYRTIREERMCNREAHYRHFSFITEDQCEQQYIFVLTLNFRRSFSHKFKMLSTIEGE